MKRLIVFLCVSWVLAAAAFAASVGAATCLEYNGVDGDGVSRTLDWCLSLDQESANRGIYKLDVTGMILQDSEKGTWITSVVGSESTGSSVRDTGTAFLVVSGDDLYVFFAEVTDFEVINMGVEHSAYLYDLRYENGSFVLKGWWHTIYWSPLDLIANVWLWYEPSEPVIFTIVQH